MGALNVSVSISSDPAAYTCIPSRGSSSQLLKENYAPSRHEQVPRIGPQLLKVPRESSEVHQLIEIVRPYYYDRDAH